MPSKTVAKRPARPLAKLPSKMPTLGDVCWFAVSRVAWPVVAWSGGHALRGTGRCVRWSARNSGRMAAAGARTLHVKGKTAYGQHKEWRTHKARHGLRAVLVHCGGCGDTIPLSRMSEHMAKHDVLDTPVRPAVPSGAQVRADEPRPPIWAAADRLDRLELAARPSPLPPDPDGLRRCGACEFHGTERAYQKHLPVCARKQLARKQQSIRDEAILAAIETNYADPIENPPTPQTPATRPAPAPAPAGKEISMLDPTGSLSGAEVFATPMLNSTKESLEFFDGASKELQLLVNYMAAFSSTMERIKMPKEIRAEATNAAQSALAMQKSFERMHSLGESFWLNHPEFEKAA